MFLFVPIENNPEIEQDAQEDQGVDEGDLETGDDEILQDAGFDITKLIGYPAKERCGSDEEEEGAHFARYIRPELDPVDKLDPQRFEFGFEIR